MTLFLRMDITPTSVTSQAMSRRQPMRKPVFTESASSELRGFEAPPEDELLPDPSTEELARLKYIMAESVRRLAGHDPKQQRILRERLRRFYQQRLNVPFNCLTDDQE